MKTVQKALKEYEQRKSSAAQSGSSQAKSSIPGVQAALEEYRSRNAVDTETYNRRAASANNVSNFLRDSNAFFNAAQKDTSSGSRFDAAAFFEERKKQADALKERSLGIAEDLEKNRDAYSYADYLDLRDYLSAFDTNVDDVMRYYGQSNDAAAGMRAYEDEMLATREKMAQMEKLYPWAGGFAVDPSSPAFGMFQKQREYSSDNRYQEVNDQWTEEEKYTLGLLYQEDPQKARDFAVQVNDQIKANKTKEDRKAMRENAADNKLLHTAGSLAVSTFLGGAEFMDRIAEYGARGRTTEKDYLTPWDYSQESVQGITEDLNQQYGTIDPNVAIIGGKGVGDIFNIGYNIGQNLLSAYILGPIGGQPLIMANYFANAATSTIDDARRRGASGNQAMALGLLNGAFEVATEFLPTGELLKMGPAVTYKELLKDVGLEALSEFAGESINAGLGYLSDKSIMGNLSEFETKKREYMEAGLPEEEAQKRAIKDAWSEVLYSGLSGAVSGTVSAGGRAGIQTARSNYQYGKYYADSADSLVESGMESPEGTQSRAFAEQMQKKLERGEKLSGNDLRVLTAYNEQQIAAEERAEIRDSVAQELQSRGVTENVGAIADTVAKSLSGEKLSRAENQMLRGSEQAQQILTEMQGQTAYESGQWGSGIDLLMQDYMMRLQNADESTVFPAPGVYADRTAPSGQAAVSANATVVPNVTNEKAAPQSRTYAVTEGGAKQISTNKDVTVEGFSQIKDGKATIKLADGSSVAADDISYASEQDAIVYETVASLPGVSAEVGNALVSKLGKMGGTENLFYQPGIKEAYAYGYYGYSRSDASKGTMSGDLSPELVNVAYTFGRQQREANAKAKQDAVQAKGTTKKPTQKATGKYKKVVFEGEITRMDEKWQAEVDYVDFIASEFSGNTVHIFESYKGKDGKLYFRDNSGKEQRAPNGMYVDNEIWIDLNAGDMGEGLMLNTFAHEMYHHIEKWNPEKANALAEFLIQELGGESVEAAVQKQIRKAEKAGFGVEYFVSKRMSQSQAENIVYQRAMSDFVADSLETMFTRRDAAQILAKLRRQDKGLFNRIRKFVDQWLGKLQQYYENRTVTLEGAAVAELKSFEKIQQMFLEAMAEAGENFSVAEVTDEKSTTAKGDVKYSNRDIVQADITNQYKKTVDQVLNMQNTKPDHVLIGYTPKIYEELGMPSLPFVIGTGHIYSAAKTEAEAKQDSNYHSQVHYHGLGADVVKDIYEKLQAPVMIIASKDVSKKQTPMRSTHSVVAIVDVGNAQKSLLLPIEITAERTVDGIRMDVNALSSVYDRNVENLVKEAIALENTGDVGIYYAKKEALTLPGAGVRFPVLLQQSIASNSIVHKFPEKVNMNIADVTQSQQFKRWFGDWQNDPQNASKVVNADGTPKVMYHGSPAQFSRFDRKKAKSSGLYGKGFYFTDSDTHAKTYGNTYSVYLNIRNPLQSGAVSVSRDQVRKFLEAVAENEDYSIENYGTYDIDSILKNVMGGKAKVDAFQVIQDVNATAIGDMVEAAELFNQINGTDFDGIVVPTETVAFRPEQIKSATDNIGTYDPSNDDIYHSLREESEVSTSPRALLANALESVAQTPHERQRLQEYRAKLEQMNAQEQRLRELNAQIKEMTFSKGPKDRAKLQELKDEKVKAQNRLNIYDAQLLRLEGMKSIKDVLERERKKASDKVKHQHKESRTNARKRELRKAVKKDISELKRKLDGTKKQNVKQGMKGFVRTAIASSEILFEDYYSNETLLLRGIETQTTREESRLIESTRSLIQQRNDTFTGNTWENYDAISKQREKLNRQINQNIKELQSVFERERNRIMNATVSDALNGLYSEYQSLKDSDYSYIRSAYSEAVDGYLKGLNERIGGTVVQDMSEEQLKDLHKAYSIVLNTIRRANRNFLDGRSVSASAESAVKELTSKKAPDKPAMIALKNLANSIGWNYEKLSYALERIGSDTITRLFTNLADSENTVMRDVADAAEFRDQLVKKYHYNDWKVDKLIDREFVDNNGKTFKLTLGELMALYAYSRRDNAQNNLTFGGFQIGKRRLTDAKTADTYKLTPEQAEKISGALTAEQKKFVEEMQTYLSETMGAKGNEVSMEMYGVELYTEKNYFPVHVSENFQQNAREANAKEEAGLGSLAGSGFTHEKNAQAKEAFMLDSFLNTWARHVNEMSRYHGAVLALEDIRRVMNYRLDDGTTVRQALENSAGEKAVRYLDELYREANSGAVQDRLEREAKKFVGKFRKNAVAYSLSVLFQQPGSIYRAAAIIPRKYFGAKGFGTLVLGTAKAFGSKLHPAYNNAYQEMRKYAPGVTIAKEIGGFDTASGSSIYSYLLDTNKNLAQTWKTESGVQKGKVIRQAVDNNWIANLPNVADKIAWIEIWNACKREIKATRSDLAVGSEAYLQAVGKRFTQVIRDTQVYDSIFAKSPLLRSKNVTVQTLVSFMNEPNTVANMVESGIRDLTIKGNRWEGTRKLLAVFESLLITNALAAFVYAMRDDDEDEAFIEKYLSHFIEGVGDDLMPWNYIPFVKDIASMIRGYDVTNPMYDLIDQTIDSVQNVLKIKAKMDGEHNEAKLQALDQDLAKANWELIGAIGGLLGIPVKNVYRDVMALLNLKDNLSVGGVTWGSLSDSITAAIQSIKPLAEAPDTTTGDKLYEALARGDTEYAQRLESTFADEKERNSEVRAAIRRAYESGKIDKKQARKDLMDYAGADIVEAHDYTREWTYQKEDTSGEEYNKYNALYNALESGENLKAVVKDYTDGGTAPDTLRRQITGTYKEKYVEEMTHQEREEIKPKIIAAYIECGGQKENIEKTLAEWDFELENDFAYGDRKQLYLSGEITKDQLREAMMEYGGMSREDADIKIEEYEWDSMGYDISAARIAKYKQFCESAGVSKDDFARIVEFSNNTNNDVDENGKTIYYSAVKKVMAEIDKLPIPDSQKQAIALSLWKESTVKKYKLW